MSIKTQLIGAHVSIAGGFYKAIERGEKIGANCIQIFTKSNRQWAAKKITENDVALFLEYQKKSSIKLVVAHASYLINLGSSTDTAKKSLKALIEELHRCELLQIPYLVLHPGTYGPNNQQETLLSVASYINQALHEVQPKHTTLLLETMAGQGSVIGKTFEEIATILHHVTHKKHIGVCLDTCHIFAAGYEFQNKKTYQNLIKLFDQSIGLEKLKVIHINDSKKELGSCVDRHEHIGKGKITADALQFIMQDTKLNHIPKILETPKEDNEIEADTENIKTLKKYAQEID